MVFKHKDSSVKLCCNMYCRDIQTTLYLLILHLKDSEYMRSKLLENVISQLEKDIVKSEIDSKYAQFGRMKTTEHEPTDTTDYEDEVDETNIVPSIRDNEYMQHSTLWGAQYMSGN